MNITEMKQLLDIYVDDNVPMSSAVSLFNAGQNKMASAAKASLPQFKITDITKVPEFPEKYHEALVLYAAAMMKAQDSSIREKDSFMGQFIDMMREFAAMWQVPTQYKDDPNTQQFKATAGQTVFVITDFDYSPKNGNLIVYIDNVKLDTSNMSLDENGFTLIGLPALTVDQFVTAVWELHADLDNPPYAWWTW